MRSPPRLAAAAAVLASAATLAAAAATDADRACAAPHGARTEALAVLPPRPRAELEAAAETDSLETSSATVLLQHGWPVLASAAPRTPGEPPASQAPGAQRVPRGAWRGARRWPALPAAWRDLVASVAKRLATHAGAGDNLGIRGESPGVLSVLSGEKAAVEAHDPVMNPSSFFGSAPLLDWAILAVACVVLFALDWAVLQILPNTFGWYVALVGFWIAVALAFNIVVWIRFGTEDAADWAMGYGIEWMLSLDNLMMIQMIFINIRTPVADYPNVMIIGIACSIVARLLLFMSIEWMMEHMAWIRYPCAAMLIWVGIQGTIPQDDEHVALEDLVVVRVLKLLFGDCLAAGYTADGSVFLREASSGRFQASLLLVAILMIMWIDTVFSVDSVAVKVTLITNGYVAFSSSVLAMFGLRAMFFVLAVLLQKFELLQYGLCVILILAIFVALEMILSPWVDITTASTFLVIGAVFIVSIAASLLECKGRPPREPPPEGR
ncbi:unnamed protein product [Prorocentrum cordatum]|uniref:Uncharacterized protein n=1 Tax=Prorocentrum cordatum TaxID=2364126 RepID=A0ABN9QIS4_9DINO|nr:unnamed protein product [Polarella glacialis]